MYDHVRRILLMLSLAATLILPSLADAQTAKPARANGMPASSDLAETLRPKTAQAEEEHFAIFFSLEPERATTVRQMYADYREAFTKSAQALQQRLAALKPDATWAGGGVPPEDQARIDEIQVEMRTLLARISELSGQGKASSDPEVVEVKDALVALDAELQQLRSPNRLNASMMDALRIRYLGEITEWNTQRAAIDAEFDVSLQAILLEGESDRWKGWLKERARHRWLAMGILSGESVDILVVAGQLTPLVPNDVGEQIQLLAEACAEKVADALLVREQIRSEARFLPLRHADRASADAAMGAVIDREVEARLRLVQLQRACSEEMIALIPEALRPAAELVWRKAAYPRVMQFSVLDRASMAVEQLRDLDGGQRASIRVIMGDARRRLLEGRTSLYPQIDSWEPEELRRRLREQRGLRVAADPPWPSSYVSSWMTLGAMDVEVLEAIRAVLTESQWLRLPYFVRKPLESGTSSG